MLLVVVAWAHLAYKLDTISEHLSTSSKASPKSTGDSDKAPK